MSGSWRSCAASCFRLPTAGVESFCTMHLLVLDAVLGTLLIAAVVLSRRLPRQDSQNVRAIGWALVAIPLPFAVALHVLRALPQASDQALFVTGDRGVRDRQRPPPRHEGRRRLARGSRRLPAVVARVRARVSGVRAAVSTPPGRPGVTRLSRRAERACSARALDSARTPRPPEEASPPVRCGRAGTQCSGTAGRRSRARDSPRRNRL